MKHVKPTLSPLARVRARGRALFPVAVSILTLAFALSACDSLPGGDSLGDLLNSALNSALNSPSPSEDPATPSDKSTPQDDGNTIEFGGYSWIILEESDGKALIISEHTVGERPYHAENDFMTWEECGLRDYLNGSFYNAFGADEQSRILPTTVTTPNHPEYDTPGGNDTEDNIFLLSVDEAGAYFADDAARKATDGGSDGVWWWLRSPGSSKTSAACVNFMGGVSATGSPVTMSYGVRPAMWITLE
ncbi:MAG: DUF6273 domain-containing protein [Oscillospiraceae bacterium]|nr:DUF6273 domain-containing protein [Oscillospiraceae bacterium]